MALFRPLTIVFALGALLLAGCQSVPNPLPSSSATMHEVRGRVVERRAEGPSLVVEHEAIPDYMPAMTMAFAVKDPRVLDGLEPGDPIAFQYHLRDDDAWMSTVRRLPGDALPTHPAAHNAPERITPTANSIYQLDAAWTTQDAQSVRLSTFHGNPVLLAMIFTHCSYACPMIVRDMKAITDELPDELRSDVQRILVSIDPARDTPEALSRFAKAHGLDSDTWTLLRGDAEDVRTLAALLGVRYKPDADGQFSHTNLITALNREGEIIHQQRGLGDSPTTSADALRNAMIAVP